MTALLPFLLLVSVFALVFGIKNVRDTRRQEALETVARQMNLSFVADDSYGLINQLKDFALFSRERNRFFRNGKVSNVMKRLIGETEVYIFDYSYVVSSGKSSRKISQTVFFANDKNWFLPDFRMKPETLRHKILNKFGVDDIDFDENPEFSDRFWLEGSFEELVRQKFTPELQKFLLARPPVHLEGNNYYLLAYTPGKLLNPDELHSFFKNCCNLTKKLQSEGKLELLELIKQKNLA